MRLKLFHELRVELPIDSLIFGADAGPAEFCTCAKAKSLLVRLAGQRRALFPSLLVRRVHPCQMQPWELGTAKVHCYFFVIRRQNRNLRLRSVLRQHLSRVGGWVP